MEKVLKCAIHDIFAGYFGCVNYCFVFAGFSKDFTFKSLLLCAEIKFNLVNTIDEKNKDKIIENVVNWCIAQLLCDTYLIYFVEYD